MCPVGSYLQVWGKCARPSVETSFSSTVCTGFWTLDKIAMSSSLDHMTTYRRGTLWSHPPKLLVVSRTLVIVQANFFVLRGLRVCRTLSKKYSGIFLLAQYVALAQLITGFLSMALCCGCQLCVTRGGGELRSLLCLSHGPELPVFSSFTYTSGSGIAEVIW